jgi:hypothetical protein
MACATPTATCAAPIAPDQPGVSPKSASIAAVPSFRGGGCFRKGISGSDLSLRESLRSSGDVSKSVAEVGVPVLGGTVYLGVTDFVLLRAPECDDGDCGTVEKVQDAVVHPPVSDSQLMNAVAQWNCYISHICDSINVLPGASGTVAASRQHGAWWRVHCHPNSATDRLRTRRAHLDTYRTSGRCHTSWDGRR